MAGVIKKKKGLFESEASLPPRPKSLNIREAEGGFILDDHSYEGKTRVAKSLAAVIKAVKETFAGSADAEDVSEGE